MQSPRCVVQQQGCQQPCGAPARAVGQPPAEQQQCQSEDEECGCRLPAQNGSDESKHPLQITRGQPLFAGHSSALTEPREQLSCRSPAGKSRKAEQQAGRWSVSRRFTACGNSRKRGYEYQGWEQQRTDGGQCECEQLQSSRKSVSVVDHQDRSQNSGQHKTVIQVQTDQVPFCEHHGPKNSAIQVDRPQWQCSAAGDQLQKVKQQKNAAGQGFYFRIATGDRGLAAAAAATEPQPAEDRDIVTPADAFTAAWTAGIA